MNSRSVFNVIIILGVSVIWLVWASLSFTQNHIDLWRASARSKLIALKERVAITPGRHIIKDFQVDYDVPHFVGLVFDDKALTDSLEKYIGWYSRPEFGFKVSWTLCMNQDSISHRLMNYSTGSSGDALIFDEFNAQTGKQYKLDFLPLTMPTFVKLDSAWLEVGVNKATVSIGNEYYYDLLDAIARYLLIPVLWLAIITSIFTLLYFIRRRIKNIKFN